jgi:hypothetical protein
VAEGLLEPRGSRPEKARLGNTAILVLKKKTKTKKPTRKKKGTRKKRKSRCPDLLSRDFNEFVIYPRNLHI